MLISVSVSAGIYADIRYLSTSPEPVSPGGTLSVSYQVLGTGGSYPYETQTIYIDGVQKACYVSNIGEGSWSSMTRSVTAPTNSGSHTVLVKVYGCSTTGCCGSSDNSASKSFTVSGGSSISLPSALDMNGGTVTTGTSAEWFGQNNVYYYDNDAAQSADISHNQNSYMYTTITGPKTVKFYSKVSSERYYDWLIFLVDGAESFRASSEVNWFQRTYTIPGGSHTLKWKYSKDGSVDGYSDTAWVDKLEQNSCTLPVYDTTWNTGYTKNYICEGTQEKNNCYNYASDKINDQFAQPGHPNLSLNAFTCQEVINAAKTYDKLDMTEVDCNSICTGTARYQVALVVWPGYDYHWYRKDSRSDGLNQWSHKPGLSKVTNEDASINLISDPENADISPYTKFCGCYCISKSTVSPYISGSGPPQSRC